MAGGKLGTRNEHDEVHSARGYSEWKEIINKDTGLTNYSSFYFPRVEFVTHILHYLLGITLIRVIEQVAKLALIFTFLTWLLTWIFS